MRAPVVCAPLTISRAVVPVLDPGGEGGPPGYLAYCDTKEQAERVANDLNLAAMVRDNMTRDDGRLLRMAREAAITVVRGRSGGAISAEQEGRARRGQWDESADVKAALQVLRDLFCNSPPVDPLLIEARKVAASVMPHMDAEAIKRGERDGHSSVRAALAALRSREVKP